MSIRLNIWRYHFKYFSNSQKQYKDDYILYSINHLTAVIIIFRFFVSRAWYYCKACHEDIKDETLIKKCKCKNCKIIVLLFIPDIPNALKTSFSWNINVLTRLAWSTANRRFCDILSGSIQCSYSQAVSCIMYKWSPNNTILLTF